MTSTWGDLPSLNAQAHRGAGRTERAAQRRAARFAGTLKGRLLHLIADSGELGLTAVEAYERYCERFGEPPGGLYSCAPRLSELEREGRVEKGPIRQRRSAYVITDAGRAVILGERAA